MTGMSRQEGRGVLWLGGAPLASSSQLLPGNASTYALFLGLGVGLVAIGLTALRGPALEAAA